ncbi:hypothetical protein GJ688_01260 [Heliobacillus mobilis]|uniref:Uncharacterized protein n=2 Tax=Heliobacterium TaxID=2697 RepID=A0A6I3SB25_HELMO|nr:MULTISPECIES: DUF5665 domain-containing protein [Heliobacterium]MBC9783299.1 hypothetical protein [Heliobacterium chlorum]MTV47607.1 hypothetical protein [Heliobacterium mobile]
MSSDHRRLDHALIEQLNERMNSLSEDIEKIKVSEYVEMLNNPKRMMYLNFLAGMARGLGMTVGFTILGAVALYILRELVVLNLPLIGGFIAEIVRMVQVQLRI